VNLLTQRCVCEAIRPIELFRLYNVLKLILASHAKYEMVYTIIWAEYVWAHANTN